jgi:hypothetical protein
MCWGYYTTFLDYRVVRLGVTDPRQRKTRLKAGFFEKLELPFEEEAGGSIYRINVRNFDRK